MTELFQIEGKPARRGDRVFHRAQTRELGKRWVEIIELKDAHRVSVRVLEGAGKGAVPSILISDLRWEEHATDEEILDIYSQLGKGSGLEIEALALLHSRDLSLQRAAETELELRSQIAAQSELLTEQNNLLSRCQSRPQYLPDDLVTGISNAMRAYRKLFRPVPLPKTAELFRSKGTGTWHVAVLQSRIWKSVSKDFRSKLDARKWATANGFQLDHSAKEQA
ncbi:hypothetical protein [Pseudomonas sp. NPDC089569]|uniref:hypothetical protein n=1 Tax=Pseudomonas sp. NPDC089569 TaxID=3390722 RepID=UPI003D052308